MQLHYSITEHGVGARNNMLFTVHSGEIVHRRYLFFEHGMSGEYCAVTSAQRPEVCDAIIYLLGAAVGHTSDAYSSHTKSEYSINEILNRFIRVKDQISEAIERGSNVRV